MRCEIDIKILRRFYASIRRTGGVGGVGEEAPVAPVPRSAAGALREAHITTL